MPGAILGPLVRGKCGFNYYWPGETQGGKSLAGEIRVNEFSEGLNIYHRVSGGPSFSMGTDNRNREKDSNGRSFHAENRLARAGGFIKLNGSQGLWKYSCFCLRRASARRHVLLTKNTGRRGSG